MASFFRRLSVVLSAKGNGSPRLGPFLVYANISVVPELLDGLC
jgi:hypothetical protein